METVKVTAKAVNSANVQFDNSADPSRVRDLSANVSINGSSVSSLDGYIAGTGGGAQTGSFSSYGDDSLTVNFHGIAAGERSAVLAEVQRFIAGIKAAAAGKRLVMVDAETDTDTEN